MPSDIGRTITREQKLGAVFLFLFGFFAVGLGYLQLHNTLYGPFVIRPDKTTATVAYTDEKTRLQSLDTDHDGFTDYDELEFHGTSPYLPDTDSDGVNDQDEVQAGTDPLCPSGQACDASSDAVPQTTTTIASPLLPSVASPLDVVDLALPQDGQSPGLGAADIAAMAKDPKALRTLLRQSGQLTEDQLKKIDDATILKIAEEIIAPKTQ